MLTSWVSVFVIEDREQDAIHQRSVGEDAHWSGAPSDFAKAPLDGIGGSVGFALGRGFVAPAGEEVIEIVPQAGDCPWKIGRPAVSKASSHWLRSRDLTSRNHNPVQPVLSAARGHCTLLISTNLKKKSDWARSVGQHYTTKRMIDC